MRLRNLSGLVILAFLGACAAPEKPLTQEQTVALPTETLCWSYAGYAAIDKPAAQQSKEVIRAELTKRGAIDAGEWQAIARQKIARGMSRCVVMAIYGKPAETNTTADMEVVAFRAISYVMFQDGRVVNYMGAP